jgi:hypothetical protein
MLTVPGWNPLNAELFSIGWCCRSRFWTTEVLFIPYPQTIILSPRVVLYRTSAKVGNLNDSISVPLRSSTMTLGPLNRTVTGLIPPSLAFARLSSLLRFTRACQIIYH